MANYFSLKLVTSEKYHLWTDTLHIREMARQSSGWDKGLYVRMVVILSWTALEISCRDALKNDDIGRAFKMNINDALALINPSLKIKWGEGLWQEVIRLKRLRDEYAHGLVSQKELWADIHTAENAVVTVRAAVKDIYHMAGKDVPAWVDDDKG